MHAIEPLLRTTLLFLERLGAWLAAGVEIVLGALRSAMMQAGVPAGAQQIVLIAVAVVVVLVALRLLGPLLRLLVVVLLLLLALHYLLPMAGVRPM